MKRVFSILFSLIMIISSLLSLASCADTDSNAKTTLGSQVTEEGWLDNLPDDLDFSNETNNTVVFVLPDLNANGVVNFAARSVKVSEESGDAVDVALFKRNQKVQQRLGVEIDMIELMASQRTSLIYTTAINSLQSGSDDYDVIVGTQLFDITIPSLGSYLINLNTLDKYDANYIDITQPYWGTNYINEMTYNNNLYWLTGDITLCYNSTMYCTFVNGALYEKYLFGNYGSMYDIVRSGDWTIDLMQKMCEEIYIDDGSETDVLDKEDTTGMMLYHSCVDILATGCGIRYATRDSEGNLSITVNNPTTISFIEKYFSLKEAIGVLYTGNPEPFKPGEVFPTGKSLFIVSSVGYAESHLREMDNYYIIPLPKLTKEQEYRTRVGDWNMLYGINLNCKNIPMVAATLEALASTSYQMVTPVYYDEALKYKYTRDDDTAEMIDLIKKSVDCDFGFLWGDYFTTPIWAFFREMYVPSPSSVSGCHRVWNKELTKLLNKLDKNNV